MSLRLRDKPIVITFIRESGAANIDSFISHSVSGTPLGARKYINKRRRGCRVAAGEWSSRQGCENKDSVNWVTQKLRLYITGR